MQVTEGTRRCVSPERLTYKPKAMELASIGRMNQAADEAE